MALSAFMVDENRWDEKAGLRGDAVRSQVIDVLRGTRDKGDRQRRRLLPWWLSSGELFLNQD